MICMQTASNPSRIEPISPGMSPKNNRAMRSLKVVVLRRRLKTIWVACWCAHWFICLCWCAIRGNQLCLEPGLQPMRAKPAYTHTYKHIQYLHDDADLKRTQARCTPRHHWTRLSYASGVRCAWKSEKLARAWQSAHWTTHDNNRKSKVGSKYSHNFFSLGTYNMRSGGLLELANLISCRLHQLCTQISRRRTPPTWRTCLAVSIGQITFRVDVQLNCLILKARATTCVCAQSGPVWVRALQTHEQTHWHTSRHAHLISIYGTWSN